jgi:hypothetical protein
MVSFVGGRRIRGRGRGRCRRVANGAEQRIEYADQPEPAEERPWFTARDTSLTLDLVAVDANVDRDLQTPGRHRASIGGWRATRIVDTPRRTPSNTWIG